MTNITVYRVEREFEYPYREHEIPFPARIVRKYPKSIIVDLITTGKYDYGGRYKAVKGYGGKYFIGNSEYVAPSEYDFIVNKSGNIIGMYDDRGNRLYAYEKSRTEPYGWDNCAGRYSKKTILSKMNKGIVAFK